MFSFVCKAFEWLGLADSERSAAGSAPDFRPGVEMLETREVPAVFNPVSVTYNNPATGNQELHVFQTDSYGKLVDHYWNGSWHWVNLGRPTAPSGYGIVRLDGATPAPIVHNNRLHVFVTGENGRLYDYVWLGSGTPDVFGTWHDRSLDRVSTGTFRPIISGTPAPVVHQGNLHVFVRSNGSLYSDVFTSGTNGGVWQWRTIGNGGAYFNGDPVPIVYNNTLHVYATANDGNLYDVWLSGATWRFDSHGNGGSTGFSGKKPSVVVYNNHLHVYITGGGNLYDHWWDGGRWHFDNHGGPGVSGTPSAVVYGGNLHVFVRGYDNRLYDHRWNGAWHWDDHYAGEDGFSLSAQDNELISNPTAITYGGNLYVFGVVTAYYNPPFGSRYNETDLWCLYWNGAWDWDNHGHV